MQCPHCQSPIEPTASSGDPTICKSCGATVSAEVVPAKASAIRQSRSWLATILWSTLFLVLATVSVASTIVAKRSLQERDRVSEERDRIREDFLQASTALGQCVGAVATSAPLKGAAAEPARKAILEPALACYQKYVQAHNTDKSALAAKAAAYLHMATIQAKLGLKESVPSFSLGLQCILQLSKEPDVDPASFPSVQTSVLKLVTQGDWLGAKGISPQEMQTLGLGLLMNAGLASTSLEGMARKHPDVVNFRDDVAGLQKAVGSIMALVGRNDQALTAWLVARDMLETVVRDRPADAEYKTRLAESLIAAAKLQKSAKQLDEAAANYHRAVEIREQLAAASPDDKTLQQDLTIAKRELDKLKPAQASNDAPAANPPTAAP
jgi:tetratricopeptide (TPR) repeat protein